MLSHMQTSIVFPCGRVFARDHSRYARPRASRKLDLWLSIWAFDDFAIGFRSGSLDFRAIAIVVTIAFIIVVIVIIAVSVLIVRPLCTRAFVVSGGYRCRCNSKCPWVECGLIAVGWSKGCGHILIRRCVWMTVHCDGWTLWVR